jgi:hypothetical protein
MIPASDWAQACGDVTWVYVLRKLDHDTYAVESTGEVSLVNRVTLENLLRHLTGGGPHEVGGGAVG